MPEIVALAPASLTLHPDLQPREDIDQRVIRQYRDLLLDGVDFPPVVAFKNGKGEYLLSDGYHRAYAYREAKRRTIPVEVHQGDMTAAVAYSVQANATHGFPRSDLTLARAYEIAVKYKVIKDPADAREIVEAIKSAKSTAHLLCATALALKKADLRSRALQMRARGMTQVAIAKELGVTHQTVGNWLAKNSEPENFADPEDDLPPQSVIEEFDARLKAALRQEMLPEIRAEVRAEYELERERLMEEMQQAEQLRLDGLTDAERQREELRLQVKALEGAGNSPIGETDAEREARLLAENERRNAVIEAIGEVWFPVIRAFEVLARLPKPVILRKTALADETMLRLVARAWDGASEWVKDFAEQWNVQEAEGDGQAEVQGGSPVLQGQPERKRGTGRRKNPDS